MENILELKNVSKSFPGVKALENVQFELKPGEIHALMGENGAGKSTLIKIITGVYQPDSGSIFVSPLLLQRMNYAYKKLKGNDTEVTVKRMQVNMTCPQDAQSLGIAAIYQHVTCFPDISVAENIFMGHEKSIKSTDFIDWKTMHKETQELLEQLDAKFSSRAEMGSLSVSQQQLVEIAKALSTNAKIIIMDEPTAPLSCRECEDLYRITESLRDKGVSIIFISHRFDDIHRLADRVTVFRDGKYINTWNKADVSENEIVLAMVGREITQFFPKREAVVGEEIFRVENFSRTGFFKDVSFSVKKGEIVALTGLVGAGRTEVCDAIYGITQYDSGFLYLNGKKMPHLKPAQAIVSGIGYLPEDRLKQGLVLRWEIAKNISLSVLKKFLRKGMVNLKKENIITGEIAGKLGVKAVNVHDKVSTLSGGNQQKVVVGKLLGGDLKLIILDEPTKGVDVGAKTAIYEIMNDLVKSGYGIIMVSSEMPEVLGMSDRIVVMHDGRVTAIFDTKETDQAMILRAAMHDLSESKAA
ncbi:MAG: sugar ABC transporter ATP-binding protein [Treponema sp.]|nr:sugar ABC transporter ATP-binding protein [Treponema sp.]